VGPLLAAHRGDFHGQPFERLDAELKAIALWDEIYRLDTTHRVMDEISYGIRQERRREVMREIQRFRG
jgi:hypothetical protein